MGGREDCARPCCICMSAAIRILSGGDAVAVQAWGSTLPHIGRIYDFFQGSGPRTNRLLRPMAANEQARKADCGCYQEWCAE